MTEPPQDPLPADAQTDGLDESGAEPASPASADKATNTADPAQKPILAAIVSEASKNLSGKIFLGAWVATLAIAGITFSISYLKASNWLNRGQEIGAIRNGRAQGQVQPSCVQRHFQGMLPSMLNSDLGSAANAGESSESPSPDVSNPNLSDAANAEDKLEKLRRDTITARQKINTRKLELITKRSPLPTDASELQKQALEALEADIKKENVKLDELNTLQRELGIPRISVGEVTQLSEQDRAIQERIYVHYDITRTFYAIHQAGSVGAALALLFGSIVLIFITSDIWEGKIKNNPGLVFPLILFGSTYILFLNLPTVLSAEEIYQANLAQYVGYINLEEEICTVLATERFVGDSNQPGTIQEIQFNRLVHSVEQRMRELNTRTITSNVGAIDSLRFDLDALSYPRIEQKPK